jgi:hypothetical protein
MSRRVGSCSPDMLLVLARLCKQVMLNEERPLLKAVSFVGQSTDAEGRKGLKVQPARRLLSPPCNFEIC